jgi:hypothetical protein
MRSKCLAVTWLDSFLRNVAKLIQKIMPESFLFHFGTATYVEDTLGNLFVETCLSRQQHVVSLCLILHGQALATLAFGRGERNHIFWTLITKISCWQMEFVEACMICPSVHICVDSCKLVRIPSYHLWGSSGVESPSDHRHHVLSFRGLKSCLITWN